MFMNFIKRILIGSVYFSFCVLSPNLLRICHKHAITKNRNFKTFRQFKFIHTSDVNYSIAPVMKVSFRLPVCHDNFVREFVLS